MMTEGFEPQQDTCGVSITKKPMCSNFWEIMRRILGFMLPGHPMIFLHEMDTLVMPFSAMHNRSHAMRSMFIRRTRSCSSLVIERIIS